MSNREKLNQALSKINLPKVKAGEDSYHRNFQQFVNLVNSNPGATLLEIGSRNVSDNTRREMFDDSINYLGFDLLEGENVDIVGDVHEMSKLIRRNSVDFILAVSVLEHLVMPWKAVLEMNSVLRTGGQAFIATHPTWPPHELPADYFRFLQHGAIGLFNQYTGFEIVNVEEGLPCRIIPLIDDPNVQKLKFQPANLGITILAKKTRNHSEKLAWSIAADDITGIAYPSKEEAEFHAVSKTGWRQKLMRFFS